MIITNITLVKIKNLNISLTNLERYLQLHYPRIFNQLFLQTNWISKYLGNKKKIPLKSRFYLIENNITETPKCVICGKPTRFAWYKNRFSKWCSSKCECLDKETQNKLKSTKLLRYGDENYNNIEKQKNTVLSTYGKINTFQVDKFKEKLKQTNIDKYGVDNCMKHEGVKNLNRYIKAKTIYDRFKENKNYEPLFTLEDFMNNGGWDFKYKWRCKKCGNIFIQRMESYYDDFVNCFICNPKLRGISYQEKEMLEYVKSIYNGEIIENTRDVIKPKELDVYLPTIKLAIEYNGEYWHYISKKKKNTLIKYIQCLKNGIKLIVIRERNWINRKDDVKRFIFDVINIKNHS